MSSSRSRCTIRPWVTFDVGTVPWPPHNDCKQQDERHKDKREHSAAFLILSTSIIPHAYSPLRHLENVFLFGRFLFGSFEQPISRQ
jgi:hypothetical protein